jgi:hypothetical protein
VNLSIIQLLIIKKMKIIVAGFLFILSLFAWSGNVELFQTTYKKTSLVIVKVDKPTPSSVSRAIAITSKYHGLTHEYSCSVSGIIIYRYNHNLNERADVVQFFQKTLAKELSGIKTEIVFCDIMSNENIGKC